MLLRSTAGPSVDLARLGPGRTVLYVYPLNGQPGVDLPPGWDTIPGARGCTAQACDFRDHHDVLRAAGVARVFGLSAQRRGYQRELVDRLHLPFAMLADPAFALRHALGLPTFEAGTLTVYQRLTLIIQCDVVEHVFHPIAEPDRHARQVLTWLTSEGSLA
ncbi:hypothetical protein Air01nite_35590 [Asanoa iriomotensis]|uniref:Redoxin domain-containing protein n=1 Tax=Asanoa iriomotensis TaxID=234613 RepID=A0ABQ4C3Y2_9ACTN|nr:hypothetical protein Air01nite_35590 [Asanoa iriomotensis]